MVRSQYLSTIMYACQSWLKQCERHNYGSKYSTSAGCILTSFSNGGPPSPPILRRIVDSCIQMGTRPDYFVHMHKKRTTLA